jgi:hypothetical protein
MQFLWEFFEAAFVRIFVVVPLMYGTAVKYSSKWCLIFFALQSLCFCLYLSHLSFQVFVRLLRLHYGL